MYQKVHLSTVTHSVNSWAVCLLNTDELTACASGLICKQCLISVRYLLTLDQWTSLSP